MAKDDVKQKDQSMEEILQSIKRIIAEESDDSEATNTEDNNIKGSEVLEIEDVDTKKAPPTESGQSESAAEDEVLELTEAVDDETESSAASDGKAMDNKPDDKSEAASSDRDVLANIDNLLSDDAAKATSAALKNLTDMKKTATQESAKPKTPSMQFRSGTTVEDLVLEALRPMLKEWLDQNLPGMVEEMVEKEIKKLTS